MALADISRDGVIPASGTLEIRFQPRSRQRWVAQQISITAPNVGSAAVGNVYRDRQFVSFFIPTGDMVGDVPYLPLSTGQTLRVIWTNATPGATVHATLYYDDGEDT
jgi:hypothetical protein